MSNLTATVPGTFDALYALFAAAGAALDPVVPVFHSEVLTGQQTQNGYVLLAGVENHKFTLAALGSYAYYETYDICGSAAYFQGGPDPTTLVQAVLAKTWSIYQDVVMTPVVLNRGADGTYVLGDAAPVSLTYVEPVAADYTGAAVEGGFAGEVQFRYFIKSRITVS